MVVIVLIFVHHYYVNCTVIIITISEGNACTIVTSCYLFKLGQQMACVIKLTCNSFQFEHGTDVS